MDMTPKTRIRDRYEDGLAVPPTRDMTARAWPVGCKIEDAKCNVNHEDRMTLCGSEVPQDRWRGRTAGSGMWTLTRDYLLSWSLDDPAIPYG